MICIHDSIIPVTAFAGEYVADLCLNCDMQLPPGWAGMHFSAELELNHHRRAVITAIPPVTASPLSLSRKNTTTVVRVVL